jgi:hypothetical protein
MTQESESGEETTVEIIRDELVAKIDDEKRRDAYDKDDDIVKLAQSKLAGQYKKYVRRFLFKDAIILLLALGLIWRFSLNPQIYGLTLNIYGTVLMAFSSLNGRYTIATMVNPDNIEEQIEVQAESTVLSNIGIALLGLGFLVQAIFLF